MTGGRSTHKVGQSGRNQNWDSRPNITERLESMATEIEQNRMSKGDPYNYWNNFPKPGTNPNKSKMTPVMSVPQRGPYRPNDNNRRTYDTSTRNLDFQPAEAVSVSNRYEGLLSDIDYRSFR